MEQLTERDLINLSAKRCRAICNEGPRTGKKVYGHLIHNDYMKYFMIFSFDDREDYRGQSEHLEAYSIDENTIEFAAPIRDSGHREIYENDIVGFVADHKLTEELFVIELIRTKNKEKWILRNPENNRIIDFKKISKDDIYHNYKHKINDERNKIVFNPNY